MLYKKNNNPKVTVSNHNSKVFFVYEITDIISSLSNSNRINELKNTNFDLKSQFNKNRNENNKNKLS